MIRRLLTLAVAATVLGLVQPSVVATQKPLFVETTDSHVSNLTLPERFASSDLVVQLLIEEAAAEPNSDEDSPVGTVYTCRAIEVYRGDVRAGDPVIVKRMGGVREERSRIHRLVVRGFPDFTQGEQYVLFLKKPYGGGDYFLVDADGSYKLTEGIVRAVGRAARALDLDGTTQEDFVRRLKMLRAPK